jgi:peptide/nickel transport system ATP-binding protein
MSATAQRDGGEQPQRDGGEHLLHATDVTTWLPTARGMLRAVDGVSLTLDRGRSLGVVGESGSGKSLLARSLMNLLPANAVDVSGSVMFRGRDLRRLAPSQARHVWGRDVAMVFQDPMTSLNPVMRVGRQLDESLRAHLDFDRRQRRKRALEMLERVGIPEPERRLSAYPHELSGGMRQRVGIAIALACKPAILIADEPTTALDVTIQRQILDLLSDLQRNRGMALLLITHDLAVVAGRTDDVAVMYAGQVVESAPTRALFRASRHPYTAALLGSVPRLDRRSHERLAVIPGRPPRVVDPEPGCRFAPRCPHAQPRCLAETPPLGPGDDAQHRFACFYPTGTPAGEEALARNRAAGRTAAGLEIERTTEDG